MQVSQLLVFVMKLLLLLVKILARSSQMSSILTVNSSLVLYAEAKCSAGSCLKAGQICVLVVHVLYIFVYFLSYV